jgi:hypothetical protein
VGTFTNLLNFSPQNVQQQVRQPVVDKAVAASATEMAQVSAQIKQAATDLKPEAQRTGDTQTIQRLETLARQIKDRP